MTLKLHNTLTRTVEEFIPEDETNVRMYVCGPTVYDRPHIGNARAVVVYDVLYRLLRHLYGEEHVTYARNITDVDDKINKAAKERGITIQALTTEITDFFHADMEALNCLPPDIEPRATEHIAEMIAMIKRLIARGCAYEAAGHVLFDVPGAMQQGLAYGQLSGKKIDELQAGARVAVEDYKRSPEDFVLWKPADEEDDASSKFDSPWGVGRPGWHIECSAMSTKYLGETFDIHGGGADLKFPHHENEIAQSLCGCESSNAKFARTWVHNGFVTVNGEKMSKSLGNFITVRELLEQGIPGEVIRLVLLMTKYNEPLDWNEKKVSDAKKMLDKMYGYLDELKKLGIISQPIEDLREAREFWDENIGNGLLNDLEIYNDMNSSSTISELIVLLKEARYNRSYNNMTYREAECAGKYGVALVIGSILGILQQSPDQWFGRTNIDETIETLANQRIAAKKAKNFDEADRLRGQIEAKGYRIKDIRDAPGYELERLV